MTLRPLKGFWGRLGMILERQGGFIIHSARRGGTSGREAIPSRPGQVETRYFRKLKNLEQIRGPKRASSRKKFVFDVGCKRTTTRIEKCGFSTTTTTTTATTTTIDPLPQKLHCDRRETLGKRVSNDLQHLIF